MENNLTQHYVVGFLFGDDEVILIQKNRPDWQKGMLNGVGGKVEPGETHQNAMIREFQEEAGVRVTDWNNFANLSDDNDFISFWTTTDSKAFSEVKTTTDENITKVNYNNLSHYNVISNLLWLVPLASQSYKYERVSIHFYSEA